jgi:hypothetical protein
MIDGMGWGWGISAHNEPERSPTRYPPITLRGLAVTFLGMVNTMKAVAPIDAINTACSIVRSSKTPNTTVVGKRLW